MDDRILMIETAGRACSAAISEGARVIAAEYSDIGMSMHSRTIMVMVDSVLKKADLSPSDIDFFAADVGPGSFTGVRIGICTAKGLAKAVSKPVIAVDALEAIAVRGAFFDGVVCPMIDARCGESYFALFEGGGRLCADGVGSAEVIAGIIGERPALFMGDGASAYEKELAGLMPDARFAGASYELAGAAEGCTVAYAALGKNGFVTAEQLVANYVRESGAVRKRQEVADA